VKYNIKKKDITKTIRKRIARIPITVSILSIVAFFYDFGFEHEPFIKNFLNTIYLLSVFVGIISIVVRYFFKEYRPRLKSSPFDFILFLFAKYSKS